MEAHCRDLEDFERLEWNFSIIKLKKTFIDVNSGLISQREISLGENLFFFS